MDSREAAEDASLGWLVRLLAELVGAVDADLGATLSAADADGTYEPIATSAHGRAGTRRRSRCSAVSEVSSRSRSSP